MITCINKKISPAAGEADSAGAFTVPITPEKRKDLVKP
jgi:hypothetical protein